MKRIAALLSLVSLVFLATNASAVVINEFMYETSGGNYFIELYNRSGRDINVNGWRIYKTQEGGGTWDATPVYTLPNVTLTADQHFLLASQDVFVTVPDAEEPFSLPDPVASNVVEGIRLTSGTLATDLNGRVDTVLYGPNAAMPPLIEDDTDMKQAARVIPSNSVAVFKADGSPATIPQVNISTEAGSGARRSKDGGFRGEPGDGKDSNNSALDFVGVHTGGASPRSRTTPVTISLFEIE